MACRHHRRGDKKKRKDVTREVFARDFRRKCADDQYAAAVKMPKSKNNGDENRYAGQNYFSQYSKGLPHHSSTGLVRTHAYQSLLAAVKSGKPSAYDAIVTEEAPVKLVNPQAALSLDLQACDAQACYLRPAPTFTSDEQGVEMIELYWMSLLRDAPFLTFSSNQPKNNDDPYDIGRLMELASAELGVAPETLFRNVKIPGVKAGPFVSQFLWMPAKMGATMIDNKMEMPFPKNYLTNWPEFVQNQNGQPTPLHLVLQGYRRYITTPRDLSHYVQRDLPYQAAQQTALILMGDLGAPLKKSNPYYKSVNQEGFVTLARNDLMTMLASVVNLAMKCVWYQKWNVHRRLRPEAYGGCVDRKILGVYDFPVNEKVLESEALALIFENYASYLLPQAYPEGAPLHPAYASGHAVFAGASITILKAWFDETHVIPNPVQASGSGNDLLDYPIDGQVGVPLTVGGELNKLAYNVGVGREFAGIHYRSDVIQGMKLGEQVAITLLKDRKGVYNEPFSGWSFTDFEGKVVKIANK